MTLIGSLIKKGIELNRVFQSDLKPAQHQQETQLKALLEKAKDTAFGKYYGFESLVRADDIRKAFKSEVPIFDYQSMHEGWWKKQQKYPDITWPGKPEFFALSSGTTGKTSKRIPITKDFLQSMRDVGQSLIKDLPNFDFPESLFESEILMLSSSANLIKHEEGHLEGEISGINVSNFPGWYDLFYRPGKSIAAIPDWDERVRCIVKEAPHWNIGAIAGIPSWVLLMMKEIVKHYDVKNIHEIWPNLTVYSSGGVAFETFRKDFEAITARPLTIIDTYLASEGFFSYTARADTLSMKLALAHGYYYEFIPFDERGVDEMGSLLEEPETHVIEDVVTDQEYVLVVSTCAGAWRYMIGDTIKFTSLDPHEILITGRTKFFLNVVGSQLSEEKLDEALLKVCDEMEITINEYSVGAIRNEEGDYIHQWVVVTDAEPDEQEVSRRLDDNLKEANKNYRGARSKALKGLSVMAITKAQYYAYLDAAKKKGGQVKTPKVMDEEKMKDFLVFIQSS